MATELPVISKEHGIANFTYEFPPGTEIVDETGKEDTIHYPMPTASVQDPLNWTRTWKFITYGAFLFWLFWSTFPLIGTASMYQPFIVELGFTPPAISQFLAWTAFMSGIGNLIWTPLAAAYGRRPVILFTTLASMACVVWFSKTTNYRSMLWSRIMLGLFMAPVECFAPMIIGDMFFTAQRARAHSLFFIILLTSTSIGGAIAGAFVDSSAGWKGFWYFNAAMVAAAFLVVLFFMPETAFYRSAASSRGVHGVKAASQNVIAPETSSDEKKPDQQAPAVDEKKDNVSIFLDEESTTIDFVGKGFPSKHQKYGLLAGRDKTYSPLNALWRVVQTLTIWPAWICIGWFGAVKGILVGQNYVAAQIWQAPPYNFSNAEVGMVNIPAIVGTVAGAIFWGWLSDWDLARRTRNNKGIREPEMRLYLIIPGAIIGFLGGQFYGLGAERRWAWEIVLILANTLNWFGYVGCLVCSLSYSVDAYNRVGGEIGLLMCVIGNSYNFALGYYVNDMLASRGYNIGVLLMQVPCLGMLVITIAYIFVGKQFRRWTANHPLVR